MLELVGTTAMDWDFISKLLVLAVCLLALVLSLIGFFNRSAKRNFGVKPMPNSLQRGGYQQVDGGVWKPVRQSPGHRTLTRKSRYSCLVDFDRTEQVRQHEAMVAIARITGATDGPIDQPAFRPVSVGWGKPPGRSYRQDGTWFPSSQNRDTTTPA